MAQKSSYSFQLIRFEVIGKPKTTKTMFDDYSDSASESFQLIRFEVIGKPKDPSCQQVVQVKVQFPTNPIWSNR